MIVAQRGNSEFLVAPLARDLVPGLLIQLKPERVLPVRLIGSLLKHGYWDGVSACALVRQRVLELAASHSYLLAERTPVPNIFVPTASYKDWQRLLAQPERHWKTGYSAMTLARAWEGAPPGDFPPEVRAVLESGDDLRDLRLLLALPEYPVALPGGVRSSQTDVLVLARGPRGLVSIAVEGKVEEPFGPTLREKRNDPSPGAALRLEYLLNSLALPAEVPDTLRYQLLHRAVSALLVAEQFNAATAVLLVHFFSPENAGFDDFAAFAGLFAQRVQPGMLTRLGRFGERDLFAGWCGGDPRFRGPEEARANGYEGRSDA